MKFRLMKVCWIRRFEKEQFFLTVLQVHPMVEGVAGRVIGDSPVFSQARVNADCLGASIVFDKMVT